MMTGGEQVTAALRASRAVEDLCAAQYRKLLRTMKAHETDINDAPPEVQRAVLALHQNALTVWARNKEEAK
jgi:hypothetical protein